MRLPPVRRLALCLRLAGESLIVPILDLLALPLGLDHGGITLDQVAHRRRPQAGHLGPQLGGAHAVDALLGCLGLLACPLGRLGLLAGLLGRLGLLAGLLGRLGLLAGLLGCLGFLACLLGRLGLLAGLLGRLGLLAGLLGFGG